jgi:signal transduction histidine kinase
LAASESLDQGDRAGFYREATRLIETQTTWLTIILLSSQGQPLVNSNYPLGTPLPSVNETTSLARLVETLQPTVGDLVRGNFEEDFVFPVRVPVIHEGDLRYILTATITPEALATMVNNQIPVEGEWTRAIVDGLGIVVARTRNPERFVGQRGTPSFLQQISDRTEGVYQDMTLDGKRVYVAFSRVDHTDWTAAVTVPVEVIQSPVRRAMGLVIGSGVALLWVSGVGAFLLSRQISRSITSTASAAKALAQGKSPHPPVSPLAIREVVVLGQSLELAAALLSQREREREENLKRAEAARAEAETANRMKDEFLAVLSHELRTPLNPILGWSGLLRAGKLDAAKTAVALEAIERNAKLQTQLIEDLLDVTRIMQGKVNFIMTPVNLEPVLEDAVETVRLAAEAKLIQLETIVEPNLGPVLGDATRLQQVIWNLLSNAVKFTAEGGRVTIQLSRLEDQAHIQVSDTGKGIHPDFLPHVFEYFRQEDGTTTRKFGGLGLGLAIVRHLVELHGGTAQVDSPGEGQGATFTVRLPLLAKVYDVIC